MVGGRLWGSQVISNGFVTLERSPICSPIYQIYKLIEVLNLGPDIYSSQTSEPSEIKESVLIIMKAVTHVLNLQWRLVT